MGFKDLFIVKEEDSSSEPTQQKPVAQPSTTRFPTAASEPSKPQSSGLFNFGSTPAPTFTPPPTNVSQEHLMKALEVYQNGFDSLNQAGYDFYEFYQAIMQGGVDNAQIYPMAFTMANAMDKTLTKDKLIQTADFYLNEINKVYSDYVAKGNGKKQDLTLQKNNENQALVNELSMMEQQMEALRTQIQDRQNKLNAIDTKYGPMINEIDSKISANEAAKTQITNSIQQVKNGIINNIK
jgi:hypothetical protein